MNPGTAGGGGVTRVGDDGLFMMSDPRRPRLHRRQPCDHGQQRHARAAMSSSRTTSCSAASAGSPPVRPHRPRRDDRRHGRGGRRRDPLRLGASASAATSPASTSSASSAPAPSREQIHGLRAAFGELFEGEGTLQDRARRSARRHRRQPAGGGGRRASSTADSVALLHPAAGLMPVPGDGLAIVAGRGDLPRLIAEDCARRGRPYRVVAFDGGARSTGLAGHPVIAAEFEKPGRLFADLRGAGCRAVTFAGGMRRPELDPLRFDLTMLRLAPKAARRAARRRRRARCASSPGSSRAEGFAVARAARVPRRPARRPPGVPTRAQPERRRPRGRRRAAAIVAALGGGRRRARAAVVAQGVCLGLEIDPGHRRDARLRRAHRRPASGPTRTARSGVLYKAPKPGQDWRIDLPAIGPDTVAAAARRRARRDRRAGGRRAAARPRRDRRGRRRGRALPLGPRGRERPARGSSSSPASPRATSSAPR